MTTSSTKEAIAEICLDRMKVVSEIAARHGPATDLDANLAYTNTATAETGIHAVRKGLRDLDQRTRALVKEPLVAWLRVVDEEGGERTLLVSRHTTVTGVDGMTMRDAPMGQLASFPPGDGKDIPGHGFIEVLERSIFDPLQRNGEWDGTEALIERDEKRPLSNIVSLRALLDAKDTPAGDPFGFDAVPAAPVRRIRRDSTLKDIAILDQWQDAVFRHDPGDRVLLLGPPGTGKTTTLVKRVAFHLNTQPRRAVEGSRDHAGRHGCAS